MTSVAMPVFSKKEETVSWIREREAPKNNNNNNNNNKKVWTQTEIFFLQFIQQGQKGVEE